MEQNKHFGIIRTTFPIVKSTLFSRKGKLGILIVLSILIGILPAIKSELESGILQEISNLIRAPEELRQKKEFGAVIKSKLSRFDNNDSRKKDDIPIKLAYLVFGGSSIISGFFLYLVIAIITLLLFVLTKRIQEEVEKTLFINLRGAGIRKTLNANPDALPSIPNIAGQYSMAVHQGATNVSNTYGYVLDAGRYIFAILTTLAIISTRSISYAIICIVVVGLLTLISVFQARRLEQERKNLDQQRNKVLGISDDIISKKEILLAFQMESKYQNRIDNLSEVYAECGRKIYVVEEVFRRFSELLSDYGRIAILLMALAIAYWVDAKEITSIGDAYFLVSIYIRILVPAQNMLLRYDKLKRSEATSNTFLEILKYEEEAIALEEKQNLNADDLNEGIIFNHVNFAYNKNDGKNTLNQCSFRIPPKKTTMIIGPSGCGKTTIARLLLGYWTSFQGEILIGGKSICQLYPYDVRKMISYVSQGDNIIDDTIEENLMFKNREGYLNEKRDTLASVGIRNIPGYEDILQAPARNLSEGQKKRLAIARILLDSASIKILDEPMAGVDVYTIKDLMPYLKEIFKMKEQTVILISHNLSLSGFADHVIVMNETGHVEEQGSPLELLKTRGTFEDLYDVTKNALQIDQA